MVSRMIYNAGDGWGFFGNIFSGKKFSNLLCVWLYGCIYVSIVQINQFMNPLHIKV